MFGIAGFIAAWVWWPAPPEPTVEVIVWSNTHLTREGLLPEMAEQFNKAGYRTPSGPLPPLALGAVVAGPALGVGA